MKIEGRREERERRCCRFFVSLVLSYPGPRGFLLPRRDKRRERKKRREKTSGSGQWESHYHATTIGVTRIDQQATNNNTPVS